MMMKNQKYLVCSVCVCVCEMGSKKYIFNPFPPAGASRGPFVLLFITHEPKDQFTPFKK
jgi:hypothetical protein